MGKKRKPFNLTPGTGFVFAARRKVKATDPELNIIFKTPEGKQYRMVAWLATFKNGAPRYDMFRRRFYRISVSEDDFGKNKENPRFEQHVAEDGAPADFRGQEEFETDPDNPFPVRMGGTDTGEAETETDADRKGRYYKEKP